MKILELYAGSRSFGIVAEDRGHEVFSSDLIDFGGIHYVVDILEFDANKLPFVPDVIWASPPLHRILSSRYRASLDWW